MTLSFAIDANNDLALDATGNLYFFSNQQAVMAICSHCAKTRYGELIYAKKQGMPHFTAVFSSNPNLTAWQVAFRQRVQKIPALKAVQSLSTKVQDDQMTYHASIQTIYGIGEIYG